MCDSGEIKHDENQDIVIKWLENYVNNSLYANQNQLEKFKTEMAHMSNEDKNSSSKAWQKVNQNYTGLNGIKSIYLWGDPGCGKSFILETLFKSLGLGDQK